MNTIFELHPETPQSRLVQMAHKVLEKDGLILYPNDSGYAISCSTNSPKAIQKLYALKKPSKKYFTALLVRDLSQATEYVTINNTCFRYIKSRTPGPYTFILPAQNHISRKLEANRKEVGIRISPHPFVQALLDLHPYPLLNTAARVLDTEFFTTDEEVIQKFSHCVQLILRCGEIPILPTNIINLTGDEPEVLRGVD
jgi:tRNA threonylcarbamoyl adenosine modification protein (Sua5/YciO/YrdC/YwlC family)